MMDTVAIQDRIGELCHQFRLPTVRAETVSRFTAAGHGEALETLLEVLEQEAEDLRQRRIGRLRTVSRLPTAKTWETFEHDRVPLALRQQLGELAGGSFVERGVNVLAFGLLGTGKTHVLCAVRHRLVESGRSVLFAPGLPPGAGPAGRQAGPGPAATNTQARTTTTSCCSTIWATCPKGPRSPWCSLHSSPNATNAGHWASPSNLVFSQWEHIFANPMDTAAAHRQGGPSHRSSWDSMSPATVPEWLNSGVRNRR